MTKASLRNSFTVLLLMLCLFAHISLFAKTTQPMPKQLSLREAILLSLRYSPNVESAQLQRVVDKFNVAVARNQFEFQYALVGSASSTQSISNGDPITTSKNFNLAPAITRLTKHGTQYNLAMSNPLSYNESSSTNYFYNPSLTLQVTHPLIKGSGSTITQANLNMALINDEVAKLNLKNAIMSQVTQVIINYRAIVTAENALIIDKNALKASIETVNQNNANIKLGFMAPSENTQAEAAVASQRLQITSDMNAIIQSKLALCRDIGIELNAHMEVDKNISIAGATYPKGQEAKRLLFANNISYLTTKLTLNNARLSLLLAEDQQRWSLNLTGTIVQGAGSGPNPNTGIDSLFNGYNRSRSLGLELSVPIDNMSAQQQVVEAKVGYTQQKLAAKQLKLSLGLELESALQNLSILFSQIKLSKNLNELSNKSYLDALKKASVGHASMFEVTTLQTSLVSSQLQTIESEINYLNSITNFQQTLATTLDNWGIKLVY